MFERRRLLIAILLAAALALAGCQVSIDGQTPAGTDTPGNSLAGTPASSVGLPSDGQRTVFVSDVTDGDTVTIEYDNGTTDDVRLIGVDAPEASGEVNPEEFEGVPDTQLGRVCLRRASGSSSAFLQGSVDEQDATIVGDPAVDVRGRYGRLLAYVGVDSPDVEHLVNLNYQLVLRGHARVYDNDFRYRSAFDRAEAAAQANERGLWDCRTPGE